MTAMNIALIGKRRQTPDDLLLIRALIDKLIELGAGVMVERRLAGAMTSGGIATAGCCEFEGDDFNADAVISIGGDGTLLRSASAVALKDVPVLGINTGHLGFLADESLEHVGTIAQCLVGGNYVTEPRAMLEVIPSGQIPDCLLRGNLYALNEVAILRQDTASMITVETNLDGMNVADYQGDGLIISTPTGSTAYNLSVGGPVIEPEAPCFVVSPIAPHALTMRPLVVSNHRRINLKVHSRSSSYRLTLDGHTVILPLDTRLTVGLAPMTVKIIHLPGNNFFDTLRSKMLWGVSKR